MSLPNIQFNIKKNGLGQNPEPISKITGMVFTGVAVSSKINLGESYQIFSLEQAESLGIEETSTNDFAYRHIKDFYSIAKPGAELWIMLVGASITYQDMVDITKPYAKKLLSDAKGKIRVVGCIKKSTGSETITNGLDADVHLAVNKAQALCEDFEKKHYPVRAVISGNKFSGTASELKDYSETANNKVAILLSSNQSSAEAAVGLLLGRNATIPSQRKISRVKDNAIAPVEAFFTDKKTVETHRESWESIHAKKYIFLRSFANRSGYYFSSDVTLTNATDDFNSLARGFVMDEAVLIAYEALVEELSDEVPMTTSGKIHPAIIKTWQNKLEQRIKSLMTDTGKLSAAKATIDENQNILQTNNLVVGLQLLPVGYADFITVIIGFTTNIDNENI